MPIRSTPVMQNCKAVSAMTLPHRKRVRISAAASSQDARQIMPIAERLREQMLRSPVTSELFANDPQFLQGPQAKSMDRPVSSLRDDAVLFVDQEDAGAVGFGFRFVVLAVADDDHQVAGIHEMGRGTIDTDHTRTARAGNGIGGQTCTVGDVVDINLFVLNNVSRVHKILVDRQATLVVQVGLGNVRAMDL